MAIIPVRLDATSLPIHRVTLGLLTREPLLNLVHSNKAESLWLFPLSSSTCHSFSLPIDADQGSPHSTFFVGHVFFFFDLIQHSFCLY